MPDPQEQRRRAERVGMHCLATLGRMEVLRLQVRTASRLEDAQLFERALRLQEGALEAHRATLALLLKSDC